ncbi:UDP-glucose 4-epimerase [compost metagenome]
MRVLVTGAAGYLGGVLIPALLADPRISAVRGTDRITSPRMTGDSRYEHIEADLVRLEGDRLASLFDGVDVVIHLAFRMAPRPGEDLTAINVEAQTRFLTEAVRRTRRVVVASAAAAYGFDATRDPLNGRLGEDAPLAKAGVEYADQKQSLERLLDRLSAEGPAEVVRARPTNVGGPGLDPKRAPQLTGAMMLAPQTAHPIRQQLLHEADMASGFLTLLEAPPGAYNLAPDDWMTLEQAAALLGQRYMALPGWMLRPLVDLAWRGGRSLFDGSWLSFLENPPIILANDKLKSLGWQPRFTTRDTLLAVHQRFNETCGL